MKSSRKYQYISTLCVNLISLAYGTSVGWTSSNNLLLQSIDETPLKSIGPLSDEELSWITAIFCLGGSIGTLFFGWMSESYSRKFCLFLSAIPQILSWILIIFAESKWFLLISRCLSGFSGGGSYVLVPLFIIETSEDKIRGTLGTILTLLVTGGILLSFILGNYLTFHQQAYVLITIPIIFVCSLIVFPETPFYLMKTNRFKEAEKSLQFYRNAYGNGKENSVPLHLHKEMENLKLYLLDDKNSKSIKYSIKDFSSPAPRKALIIGIIIITLNEFCGIFPMTAYTATIFKEAGSNLSPNISAIIVGLIQVIGTYISVILIDHIGRRLLLTLSAFGTCVGLTTLGVYTYLNVLGYQFTGWIAWTPILSFSFSIFSASCGIITIPYIVIAEIMPEKIRNIGISICFFYSWIMAFIVMKSFATISALIGMHGTIFFYAICCLFGLLFVFCYMPETKGKRYDEIFEMLEQSSRLDNNKSPHKNLQSISVSTTTIGTFVDK